MSTRSLSVAVVTLAGLATAQAEVAPVAAELSASSTLGRGSRHAAWRAFDADTATMWCAAARDAGAGGWLEIQFAHPVTVRELTVHGPPADWRDDPPRPLDLTVTTDGGAVTAAFDATAGEPATIALPVGRTRSVRLRYAARPADGAVYRPACVAEVHVELVDEALVYGVPPAALTALPVALTALDDALRRCDHKRLARLARFPVGFRTTAMPGRRGYDQSDADDPRAYRRPRDLPCAWSVHHADDGAVTPPGPVLDGGIAPGVVRVDGGSAITTVWWELTWRAGRWQLTSLDTVFFE